MKHIHEFTVSTKKGEVQSLRFGILQDRPYPDIDAHCSALRWRNYDGIFSSYGKPGGGLPNSFSCYLLPPGITPPDDWNRTHLAGYEGRLGTFKLRGDDLGEMMLVLAPLKSPQFWCDRIRLNCCESPSHGQQKVIRELIVPPLGEYIRARLASLKTEAVSLVKLKMLREVSEKQAQLTRLKAQIEEAKF